MWVTIRVLIFLDGHSTKLPNTINTHQQLSFTAARFIYWRKYNASNMQLSEITFPFSVCVSHREPCGPYLTLSDTSTATPLAAVLDKNVTNLCITMRSDEPLMILGTMAKICTQSYVSRHGWWACHFCWRLGTLDPEWMPCLGVQHTSLRIFERGTGADSGHTLGHLSLWVSFLRKWTLFRNEHFCLWQIHRNWQGALHEYQNKPGVKMQTQVWGQQRGRPDETDWNSKCVFPPIEHDTSW